VIARTRLSSARLFVVACASLAASLTAACAAGHASVDLRTVTYGPEAEVTLAEMTRHDRGFYYRDVEVGTGDVADAGRNVTITYVLRLVDGREIERTDSNDPVRFRVGDQTVVDAFDSGVRGMRAGGTRQLVVPPRLAYGARGAAPVPPNAVLVMMVRLERVE
jgi:FKBP-type peptidyl-prolyl cis-trans isomerase